MGNYPNVGKGLKMMFWAEIAAIIAAVFSIIPLIGLVGDIAGVVCGIIMIVGVYTAGKDDAGYKKAFLFTILSLIAAFASGCVALIPVVGTIVSNIIDVVLTIFDLVVTYYVITTTANILRGIGADDVAKKGMNVWKIVMVCAILGMILGLLAVVPFVGAIAAVLLAVVAIVEVIANILYLVFLFKSYKAIGA